MGYHRQILAWADRQRNKEPLELDNQEKDQTLLPERRSALTDQRADETQDHERAEHTQLGEADDLCSNRKSEAVCIQDAREAQR